MNLFKTYLLPLILLLCVSVSTFGQNNSKNKTSQKEKLEISKTDSVLVNCYFTEREYNEIHNIEQYKSIEDSDYMYEDEFYSDKKYKRKGKGTFWNDVSAELLVDVVVNTLLFVAVLWQ